MKLPAGVAFRLFEHLDESTRHALVRAYPVLALAHAQFRARRSAWQARVPVELLRDILAYLPPADFYTACCVSAFWRECGTSDVQLLKDQLELVRANSWTSNYDLGLLDYVDEDESAKLWLYFVVAAPRRYMFGDGMRRYRVTTLDVRRAVGTPRRGIFMSDYGGIIALSTSKGLVFYSVEELLPNSPDLTPSGVDLGTLIHPRGVLYFQLRDVRIAHQQGTPGTFHVFAVYDGGSVFRASMELSVIPETHLKQATFTRFTLVYGGPPSASPVACDWSGAPPPAASFQPLNIAVVAPASPARALLSLSSAEEKHFALVRANDTSSAHPGLPVLRSKRSRMALDFLLRKSRASSPNTKPWDLLALAFPDVASTDWRAMQFDRLAIKEVYLEWLHAHTGRTPVLKSTDVVTGSHLVFEGLTPMTATLSHKGIKYSALAPLQAPLGLESVLPSAVCAIQYVQRWVLVATYYPSPTNAIYLYDTPPSDLLLHNKPPPRLLVRFKGAAEVREMKWIGGYTTSPHEPPCSGRLILAVVMKDGFVHLCQFTTADLNGQVEWSVPAARKLGMGLRPGEETRAGWRSEWVSKEDGTMGDEE